ncbi:fimbrial protein [Enterobacter huaxiensis]
MKNKYTSIGFALFATLLLARQNAAQAHDGQINITGTIQSNTCIVDTDSQNMTVNMGNVASKQFNQTGATAAVQAFIIKLAKCGDAARSVSVTFSGTVDSHDDRLLGIDGGSTAATGMGIAILDLNRQLVPLNTQSVKYPLTPGAQSVNLNFFAEYMANGDTVMAGDANATATFVLNYA